MLEQEKRRQKWPPRYEHYSDKNMLLHLNCVYGYYICINKFQIATAEAELQRMEAKLKNETGVAKAQRDFDIKKGICNDNILKFKLSEYYEFNRNITK